MSSSSAERTIEAIWKMESAKLIAALTRIVRDVGLAEDLAQDALVTALERWPEIGIPDNPGAWLMTAAKRRAIDHLRRAKLRDRKYGEVARGMDLYTEDDIDQALDGEIGDDLLRLIFMTCHPVLSQEARVALTLRLLCGLTTDEIARSFLVAESTIAQRIVRAKKTLNAEKIAFEVPAGPELKDRLNAVLEVVYLMFNEGYSATSGEHWIRPLLCQEALRLGRILAAISACHAQAPTAGDTDWIRIAALYEALSKAAPSPIVELNRAVAVSMAFGPDFGLQLVDRLVAEPSLRQYHLLPSVRGNFLMKLGRYNEARAEFERAASLTRNERERALLLNRAADCASRTTE